MPAAFLHRNDRTPRSAARRVLASIACAASVTAAAASAHPEHVSIAEARLDAATRSFEVAMRLDAVHLEEELSRRGGHRVDLDDAATDELVADYLRATFRVRAPGGAPLPIAWVGREPEGLETWLYFTIALPEPTPAGLEVRNAVLQERFTRQINTVTFIVGEQRQTLRFTPDDESWKPMTLPLDQSSNETDYAVAIERWHEQRLERLRAEDGYLTLVGLHWIDEGRHTVGRAPEHDVAYDGLPVETLGTLDVTGGSVTFTPATEARDALSGLPENGVLRSDADGAPTVLRIGSVRLHVIERSGRLAIRMRDADAPTRRQFAGVERFPVDPRWRIEAAFEPPAPEATIAIASVVGTVEHEPVAGRAVFERDGHLVRLLLLPADGPRRFFAVFGDATNGRSTYGGGRFLVAELADDGATVVLDFNRAYNPPCSFTPYATCPLPPPENRLPFAVPAGERAAGPHRE